jgi:hypothetical protein
MNTSMLKGMALGGVAMVVIGAGAVTGYRTLAKPTVAEVVAVKDVTETVVTPREHCEDVAVQHKAPVKDEHRIAGHGGRRRRRRLLGSTARRRQGQDGRNRRRRGGRRLRRQPRPEEHAGQGRRHDHRAALQDGAGEVTEAQSATT